MQVKLSSLLASLAALDLAHFGLASKGALEAVCGAWETTLVTRKLRSSRRSAPLEIFARQFRPMADMDPEGAGGLDDRLCPSRATLARWAVEDSPQQSLSEAWGMPPYERGLAELLVMCRAVLSLQGLHMIDQLFATKTQEEAPPIPLGLLLRNAPGNILWHAALDLLKQVEPTHLSEEELLAVPLLICAHLVEAADVTAITRILRTMLDILLRPSAAGATSSTWQCLKRFPPLVCRAASFAVAAAMVGQAELPLHVDGDGVYEQGGDSGRGALLAVGAELLTGLLPFHWGRPTAVTEDAVLRQAAREALDTTERCDGGWSGAGEPDVALRGASRRLRVKLGLRLGG